MTDSLFHRLVVHLSTTGRGISVDSLSHLGDQSAVSQVLTNHPAIFHHSYGSCYSLLTCSTSIPSILATYLSLSVNATRSPDQKLRPSIQAPRMMIRSKSTHFSFIPSTLASNTNQLVLILHDGSTYQVPCTFNLLSYAGGTLLAEVRFAVNSCRQLMCMVTNLSMEVTTTGEVKCLTSSDEPKHSHIPLWNGPAASKTRRSRVFVRSDLASRNRQVVGVVQELLVVQVWKLMLRIEQSKGSGGCVCGVDEIVKKLGSEESANEEKVLAVLDQYRAMFTVTGGNITLQSPSHSYWSQVLQLCSSITPATGLHQAPLSPVKLGVSLGTNTVVLRHLQGMLLPCDKMEDNGFTVSFRFSEVGDGFSVRLNNSKLKVPPEGKVIPLTLVIQSNRLKVKAVGTLGSWKEFKVSWPEGGINSFMENDLADDFGDLLLDDAPLLSRTVDAEDIVTLEEETEIKY